MVKKTREEQAAYLRAWRAANKDKWQKYRERYDQLALANRAAYFEGKVCAGYPPVCCINEGPLELDHIDPRTKDPKLTGKRAGNIWRWSDQRREVELAKCQPLCRRCHLAKTADERRDSGQKQKL